MTTAALTLVTGCGHAEAGARDAGAPVGASEVSPAPAGTGEAPPPDEDASSGDDIPGVRVNDTKARLSYVRPSGWTDMIQDYPDVLTSGVKTGRQWQPSDGIGRPADAAYFHVQTLDGPLLAASGGTWHAAKTFTNIIACPHEYQGRLVADTEATRVDGHDAWYSEGECVLPGTDRPPLRTRVTFIDTGGDAVIVTGSASAPARLDEIAMITKSLRVQ
ncbi:hypothetical protein ACWGR4_26430 [Embleya sp. NPDC055664]